MFRTGLSLLFALGLSSCSVVSSGLKARPIENSPFADAVLQSSLTRIQPAPRDLYPFHRVWRLAPELLKDRPAVFVAPIDTSHVLREEAVTGGQQESTEITELARYMRARVEEAFRTRSYPVVTDRTAARRVIELALVEVSPTDVPRNVIGTALGAVVPGGGLVAMGSSGSIAVEGVVRDESGAPLFVFADRERGKTAPFSLNDFTRYSHARVAIDDWARQLVEACAAPLGTPVPDSWAVTLLPL